MARVKSAFETLLLFQVILGELDIHQITLLDTDAVLAGKHASHLDTATQNVGTKLLGAFKLSLLVGIEQDQRVKVAVASMEDIRHTKPILLAKRRHAPHHVGQPPPRDGAVHAKIVR